MLKPQTLFSLYNVINQYIVMHNCKLKYYFYSDSDFLYSDTPK